MYELSAFITWLITVAAGILLSVLQELGQTLGWPWVSILNQKLLAITLAVLAGLVAALFETILSIDLFTDVDGLTSIVTIIGSILFASQATWALLFRKEKR